MNLPWLRKRPKRKKGLEHQPMFKIKEKFPNEYLTKPWWKNIWETFTNSFKYKNVSNVDVLVEEIKKASTVSHITSDEVWQMISTDKSGVEKEPLFDVLFVEIANITDEHKKKVEECAQKVLNVRLQFPNSSLADLYDPNTMPEELVKAHTNLDRAVRVECSKHIRYDLIRHP